LRKLRERDFGAIIDQKTGERRKMTPLEERYAMFLLGGRKGNTLRNHIRALLYGVTAVGAVATPAAMLGYNGDPYASIAFRHNRTVLSIRHN
jgi:hypothetical protein